MARSKLSAVQAQTFTSEGALTSLEEALGDRDKQIAQLREQRDRAEKDLKEEKDLHDREITDYKMKIHTLESEVEKLQIRLDKALTEKDKLEIKLESSQSELGKVKNKTKLLQNIKKVEKYQNSNQICVGLYIFQLTNSELFTKHLVSIHQTYLIKKI